MDAGKKKSILVHRPFSGLNIKASSEPRNPLEHESLPNKLPVPEEDKPKPVLEEGSQSEIYPKRNSLQQKPFASLKALISPLDPTAELSHGLSTKSDNPSLDTKEPLASTTINPKKPSMSEAGQSSDATPRRLIDGSQAINKKNRDGVLTQRPFAALPKHLLQAPTSSTNTPSYLPTAENQDPHIKEFVPEIKRRFTPRVAPAREEQTAAPVTIPVDPKHSSPQKTSKPNLPSLTTEEWIEELRGIGLPDSEVALVLKSHEQPGPKFKSKKDTHTSNKFRKKKKRKPTLTPLQKKIEHFRKLGISEGNIPRALGLKPKPLPQPKNARTAQPKHTSSLEDERSKATTVTYDPEPDWNALDLKHSSNLSVSFPHLPIPTSTDQAGPSKTRRIVRGSSKRFISVGIDFGTSCVKMCWCERSEAATESYPITHPSPVEPWAEYTLPSIAVIKNGELLLGWEAAATLAEQDRSTALQNLKFLCACEGDTRSPSVPGKFQGGTVLREYNMAVADSGYNPQSLTPSYLSTIFLAYVMRVAHQRVTDAVRSDNVHLSFLVGMPVDFIETSSVLRLFQKMLAGAEALYRNGSTHLELEQVSRLILAVDYGPVGDAGMELCRRKDPNACVIGVPESVAQVLTYVRSLGATEGLHAVVDIGAGTTDVSIFLLSRCAQQLIDSDALSDKAARGFEIRQYWLAATYIPVGGYHIERDILAAVRANKASATEVAQIRKTVAETQHPGIENRVRYTYRAASKWKSYSDWERRNDYASREPEVVDFWDWWHQRKWLQEYAKNLALHALLSKQLEIANHSISTYCKAYKKRSGSKDFMDMKVYLCGGGSLLAGGVAYCVPWVETIDTIWEKNRLRPPNVSPRYESKAAPFSRMSVAYGLSLDPTLFWGDFRLPSETPDKLTNTTREKAVELDNDKESVGALGS